MPELYVVRVEKINGVFIAMELKRSRPAKLAVCDQRAVREVIYLGQKKAIPLYGCNGLLFANEEDLP